MTSREDLKLIISILIDGKYDIDYKYIVSGEKAKTLFDIFNVQNENELDRALSKLVNENKELFSYYNITVNKAVTLTGYKGRPIYFEI